MDTIVGIKFKHTNKIYYFNPVGETLEKGDKVVVETTRGIELGMVVLEERPLDKKVDWEIKPIIRKATDEDLKNAYQTKEEKAMAMKLCQDKIDENKVDMKLIDVEYTLDRSKVIFYFIADGRVDFRDLVKSLASVFKMRIELRQIGVRDEAKMIGGIGSCGRSLCCSNWLSDFQPVSIKMAKTQNLSLNPTKISGICGRLMCCLNYENDNYIDSRKGMPDVGEEVITPDGKATVVDIKLLENEIKVKIEHNDPKDKTKSQIEIKTFQKEDIKRLKNKKCCLRDRENLDDDIPEDVKELMKD